MSYQNYLLSEGEQTIGPPRDFISDSPDNLIKVGYLDASYENRAPKISEGEPSMLKISESMHNRLGLTNLLPINCLIMMEEIHESPKARSTPICKNDYIICKAQMGDMHRCGLRVPN